MKVTNLNGFLNDPVFHNCFRCGSKKYCEFSMDGHVYRICAKCLKHPKVIKFFKEHWQFDISVNPSNHA